MGGGAQVREIDQAGAADREAPKALRPTSSPSRLARFSLPPLISQEHVLETSTRIRILRTVRRSRKNRPSKIPWNRWEPEGAGSGFQSAGPPIARTSNLKIGG